MLGCSLAVLTLLAAFHSPRLSDDSYSHYGVSVETIANADWRSLVTDTWNKPITAVAYGIIGQVGLFPARLVSVLISLATAFLVYRIAVVFLSSEAAMHPLTAVAFFLCQVSVFTQAFLTMTELLAAFFLVLGIRSIQKNKLAWAFILIGLMSLARVESCLIAGWVFLVMSPNVLRIEGLTRVNILRLAGYGVLEVLPFTLWWFCGWLYSQNPFWMSAGYVYLRPFTLKGVLSVNAFTGLPAVLSAPLLMLFILGCFRLPAFAGDQKESAGRWPIMLILYGTVLIHCVFLSLFVVYPRGSGYGEMAIGALNPRNYNLIAPVVAVFIFAGALSLFGWPTKLDERKERRLRLASLLLAQVSIIGFFFFNQQFPFKPSMALGAVRMVQQSVLLAGFMLVVLVCSWKMRRSKNPDGFIRVGILYVAAYCIISLPLTDPVFWYPLRSGDRNALAQEEFSGWCKTNITESNIVVVQDMNGRMDWFCKFPELKAIWVYAGLFQKTLDLLPVGTMALIETDEEHVPRSRYPQSLISKLNSDQYKCLARSAVHVPFKPWESLIRAISTRNDQTGWILYEKVSNSAATHD